MKIGRGQMEFDFEAPRIIPVSAGAMPDKLLRRAYRFRMYPTPNQEQAMMRHSGACRWVWNWGLARRREHYAATGKTLGIPELNRELTVLIRSPETSWLRGGVRDALTESLRNLDRAYRNFFAKTARFPRFKARKQSRPVFCCPADVNVIGDRVTVPKIGKVRIRGERKIDGKAKSATFKRDASGRWHVAVIVETAMPDIALPFPNPAGVIGIDFGLKDFAVLTDGERVVAPRFFRKAERKLSRAHRVLSRRTPGSNRRAKARSRANRIHARIADRRSDFIHKFTHRIIRDHDGVCIEDLNVGGLARTKLAKSFQDAAIAEARRQLTYKGEWNRKHVIAVDRWYPSSKTCGACGRVNAELTLSDRTWDCPCGATLDRDMNAANNIRSEGLRILAARYAESQNARGARVRPEQSGGGRRSENPAIARGNAEEVMLTESGRLAGGLEYRITN